MEEYPESAARDFTLRLGSRFDRTLEDDQISAVAHGGAQLEKVEAVARLRVIWRSATFDPMPYHRFKLGQTVETPCDGPHALIPRGPHIVVRLLPLVGDELQYRIRSSVDGVERVVVESQVRRVEGLPRPRRG